MKQAIFFISFLASIYCNATIRTVSNLPTTLAQFNTIQAAINASSSGDTVYVHGSTTTYAVFTVTNKRLVIIGPGWSPVKNMAFIARVQNAIIAGTASSGTELQGMVFPSGIAISSAGGGGINNLRFIRNLFEAGEITISCCGTFSNFLFEGNIFSNMRVNGSDLSLQNFVFQNNYFYNEGNSNGNIFGFFNTVNILFDHNLWLGPGSGNSNCFGVNCRFLTLTNNIFVRRDAANTSFSTFNNNITFNAGNNSPWDVNGNINSGGNIVNQDPNMVDQVGVNTGINNYLLNFTILTGPANNSGSDGKDMGLLFDTAGSLNWTTSRSSRLPYIFSMNIINPTIPQGGILTIQVEARKNN